MKKLLFVDQPKKTDMKCYDDSITMMVNRIKKIGKVISIYQIGSIRHPGISDIDLIVVLADSERVFVNPIHCSERNIRYLFPHGIMGACQTHFLEAQRYTFYSNYKKVWGENILEDDRTVPGDDRMSLKKQIAAEYLLKMYIMLAIEKIYQMCKLRSFLLEGKALALDLAILGGDINSLNELVNEINDCRDHWFDGRGQLLRLGRIHASLFYKMHECLSSYLVDNPIRFPYDLPFQMRRNVVANHGEKLAFTHQGWKMPKCPGRFLGRRYFNLLHRFNQFKLNIPMDHSKDRRDMIAERFNFQSKCKEYNSRFLPNFAPMVTGLGI